jgi:hypothetical protein
MIKKLFEKNIVGILGVSLTALTVIFAYQIMVNLFIRSVVNSLTAMPH